MKRLLTLVVMVVLFGWLLFKAAVWWLADQRLADVRDALEHAGAVDRGTIGSGIEGRLLLNDARYQDFRLAGPLEVGRVIFDAGSPLALLGTLMDPASAPSSWTLRGEQLAVMLESTMFRNWVTDAGNTDDALFVPVCGPDHRQQLGSGDLVRMGIEGITGEVLLEQTPDELYLEISTDRAGSLDVRWPGARLDLRNPETLQQGTGAMQLTLRDGGLMRRVAAYCARESSVATDEWTEIVMDAFRQGLNARGYEASDQLLALYRQWLTEGGELTLTLAPSEPLLGVPVLDAGETASGALEVSYNGQIVPDVYLRGVTPPAADLASEAVRPVVPEGEDNGSVAGWYPGDVADAGRWVGRTVRVVLSNGNVVEGRLASVDEQTLDIARLVGGGEVAYPIVIRAIESLEVWRRGQTR